MLGRGSLCTLKGLVSDYIERGFMGHLNDAQKVGLMHQIGVEFEFSNACVFPCSLSSCFVIPFSIVITSLGEKGAGMCATHAFVYLFCTC